MNFHRGVVFGQFFCKMSHFEAEIGHFGREEASDFLRPPAQERFVKSVTKMSEIDHGISNKL